MLNSRLARFCFHRWRVEGDHGEQAILSVWFFFPREVRRVICADQFAITVKVVLRLKKNKK